MLVGKGVTYDTGGADIKANGAMSGMSRDKCGAAAVAGFLKVSSYQRIDGKNQHFRIYMLLKVRNQSNILVAKRHNCVQATSKFCM